MTDHKISGGRGAGMGVGLWGEDRQDEMRVRGMHILFHFSKLSSSHSFVSVSGVPIISLKACTTLM